MPLNGSAEESLWGVRTVQTTQIADGTAIVMSIATAAVGWHRMGLVVEFDNGWSGTNFETNTYTWRAEERISRNVPRPAAISVVTGLPS